MASDHRVPRAFIFDCDGTLLDSMGMWLSIQPELLARHGIETVPSDFARFEHLSLEDECQAYHDTWGICSDGAEVLSELNAMLLEKYDGAIGERDGALDFLKEPTTRASRWPLPRRPPGISSRSVSNATVWAI